MRSRIAASIIFALLLSSAAAADRTWTDTQGRSMRAEFVRELDGEVTLLRGGKLITIPIIRLSAQDQQYIRDVVAGKPVDETPAPSAAPVPAPASPSPTAPPIPLVPGLAEPKLAAPSPAPAPSEPFSATPSAPATPAPEPAVAAEPDDGPEPSARPVKPDKKAPAVSRLWTDAAGQTTTAKFVRMFGRDVVLQRGIKAIKVPYDGLSPADQEYVKELLIARGLEAEIPPALPTNSEGAPMEVAGPGAIAGPAMPMGVPVPVGPFGPRGPAVPAGPTVAGPAMGGSSLEEMAQRNREEMERRAEESRQRMAAMQQQTTDHLAEQQRRRQEQIDESNRRAMERQQAYQEEQAAARTRREEELRAKQAEYEANRPAGSCSKCMRSISKTEAEGTQCPHCGAVWSFKQDAFGRRTATGAVDTKAVTAGIAVIAVIGAVAVGIFAAFIAIIVAVVKGISGGGQKQRRQQYY